MNDTMSTERMGRHQEIIREFAAGVVLFHDAIAQNAGLNLTDLNALRLLGEAPMTPGQLVERIGLTGAAVTTLVDRLIAAGYVTREHDKVDRRRITVRAIPDKIREIDRLYADHRKQVAKILDRYDDAQFAAIETFLSATARLLMEQSSQLRKYPDEDSLEE